MAYSLSTYRFGTGGRGAFSGHLYRVSLDFIPGRIHLPPSVSAIEQRPSVSNYQARQYLIGGHTANMMIDEELRALRVGIIPPAKPTVTIGSGSTPYLIYLRFFDELTGEKSSLSRGVALTGNATRNYTSLPTQVPGESLTVDAPVSISAGTVTGDPAANFGNLRPGDRIAFADDTLRWAQVRSIISQTEMTIDDLDMSGSGDLIVKPVSRVSHIESWVAPGGGLPRFSSRVPIGTLTFSETIADLALGEALTDTYEPMPRGSMSCFYNDRLLIAGVAGSLHTVYLSAIGFPERHEGLRFVTKFGEPIVGLLPYRDFVILICPESRYRLQGYTEDDYVRDTLEPSIGGIGHLCNRVTPSGVAIIPTREQITVYNGAVGEGMPYRRKEWIEDYRVYSRGFEAGYAAINPIDQIYLFLPDANRLADAVDVAPPIVVVPDLLCDEVAVGGLSSITIPCMYMESGTPQVTGLYYFSTDQTPMLRRQSISDVGGIVGAVTSDETYVWIAGQDSDFALTGNINLWRMTVRGGEMPAVVASIPFTGGAVQVSSIVKYLGDIYINANNDSTYKYSGGVLTLDDTPGGHGAMAVLGSDLFLTKFDTTWRKKSGGMWSDIAAPIAMSPPGLTLYNSLLHFGDGAGTLWSFDGSTFTDLHEVTSGSGPFTTAAFNGFLYYLHGPAYLGRYDGETFEDNHFNFPGAGCNAITALAVLDGNLVAVLIANSPPTESCNFVVATSDGTDTTSWEIQAAHHTMSGGNINGNHVTVT